MKKTNVILSFILLLFALVIVPRETNAQVNHFSGAICDVNFGTVANSVDETQYVVLPNWAKLDSISIVVYGTGEMDIDSVDIYVGHGNGHYSTTAVTAISTIDLAASTKGWQRSTTDNATVLTGAALRGVEALKLTTRGATAGNDATDPNNYHVLLRAWGTK